MSKIKIGCFVSALMAVGCVFSPTPEYPISEGRYLLVSGGNLNPGDSLIYQFLPGHLYHSIYVTQTGCITSEKKGRWKVTDDENLTFLVDSVPTQFESGCKKPGSPFRWENETAGYYKVRDISDTSYSVCDHGSDCKHDDTKWRKYVKIE